MGGPLLVEGVLKGGGWRVEGGGWRVFWAAILLSAFDCDQVFGDGLFIPTGVQNHRSTE